MGKALNKNLEPDDQLVYVLLSEVGVDEHQPRKSFDKESLVELGKSIRSEGLAQPILIEPNPDSPIPKYRIICGERRYHAAILEGLKTLPARLRIGLTRDQAVVLQAVENVQREPLTLDETCEMCARLVDLLGFDEAAAKLGKSKPWVSRRAAVITDMSEVVLDAIRNCVITDIDAAHELRKLHGISEVAAHAAAREFHKMGKTLSRNALHDLIAEAEAEKKAREANGNLFEQEAAPPPAKPAAPVATTAEKWEAPKSTPPASVDTRTAPRDPPAPRQPEREPPEVTQRRVRMVKTAARLEARFIAAHGSDPQADELPEHHVADVAADTMAEVDGDTELYSFHAYLTEQQIDALCDLIAKKPAGAAKQGNVATIEAFADAMLEGEVGAKLQSGEAYKRFGKWCKAKKLTAPHQLVFAAVLADRGLVTKRTAAGVFYTDLVVRK